MYHKELLDHYHNPRNYGILENPDEVTVILNPSCGDQISLQIRIKDKLLNQIAFTGKGCIISLAAASLLSEYVQGKSLTELEALTKDDMLSLVGMSLGPTRLRCATLALECLKKALSLYMSR